MILTRINGAVEAFGERHAFQLGWLMVWVAVLTVLELVCLLWEVLT